MFSGDAVMVFAFRFGACWYSAPSDRHSTSAAVPLASAGQVVPGFLPSDGHAHWPHVDFAGPTAWAMHSKTLHVHLGLQSQEETEAIAYSLLLDTGTLLHPSRVAVMQINLRMNQMSPECWSQIRMLARMVMNLQMLPMTVTVVADTASRSFQEK